MERRNKSIIWLDHQWLLCDFTVSIWFNQEEASGCMSSFKGAPSLFNSQKTLRYTDVYLYTQVYISGLQMCLNIWFFLNNQSLNQLDCDCSVLKSNISLGQIRTCNYFSTSHQTGTENQDIFAKYMTIIKIISVIFVWSKCVAVRRNKHQHTKLPIMAVIQFNSNSKILYN